MTRERYLRFLSEYIKQLHQTSIIILVGTGSMKNHVCRSLLDRVFSCLLFAQEQQKSNVNSNASFAHALSFLSFHISPLKTRLIFLLQKSVKTSDIYGKYSLIQFIEWIISSLQLFSKKILSHTFFFIFKYTFQLCCSSTFNIKDELKH